jgi:hypothetical protein
MADTARIVDDIRAFLFSNDQSQKPHLADLARAFADACAEINQRLAQCQRLLQQGLRTEALHLAKGPPDLVEEARVAEFAERTTWLEIVGMYGLAAPQGLDEVAIGFLQESYVDANPLEDLLRTHRRLALARAPLRQRIDVLRKLAASDSNSQVWAADVQVFEAARLDQLKEQVAEARRRPDAFVLNALNDELSSPSWSVSPTKGLVQAVRQAIGQLRQQQAKRDLGGLVESLKDAFASLDVEAAREIRKLWYQLDGNAGVKGNDPLFEQVEPAFLWLDEVDRQEEEERRHHQATADLAAALKDDTLGEDLARLREELLSLGGVVPDELEALYRSRLEEIAGVRTRKRRLAIACSLVGVAAVGAFLWAMIRANAQGLDAKRVASRIEVSIGSGRLAEARDEYAREVRSDPGLADIQVLADAEARLRSAEEAETGRAADFEAAYSEAETTPLGDSEPPALGKARSRARTDAETGRVESLSKRRLDDHGAEVARNSAEAGPHLEAAASRLDELDGLLGSETDAEIDARTGELFRQVRADLAAIEPSLARSDTDVRRRYQLASNRAKTTRKDLDARERWRANSSRIDQAAAGLPGASDEYARALREALPAVADTPRATAFQRVLDEKAAWAAALAWSKLAAGWRPSGLAAGPTEAREKAGLCARYLSDHPSSPDREVVAEFQRHYSAIAARTEGDESLRKVLIELLTHPVIGDVDEVLVFDQLNNQLTYFSKWPRNEIRGKLKVFDGFEESKTREITVKAFDIRKREKSPQSRLAAEFRRAIEADPLLVGWDGLMRTYAQRIAEDASIHPLLRLGLLRQLLPLASKGSYPLEVGLKPLLKKVEVPDIQDNLPWMNPQNQSANEAKPKAERLLGDLPAWEAVDRRADEVRRDLATKMASAPRPVGWLVKEKAWACRSSEPLPESGELRVVVPGRTVGEWKRIGQVSGGTAKIAAPDPSALVEGRIIFVAPRLAPARP